MADAINMSLDEIIKQNRRGRGGGPGRGGGTNRGGNAGRGRGRGRGNGRGRGRNRSRSRSRGNTPGPRQGRSQSRGRSRSRGRSQSRVRSRSRQPRRSLSRGRSVSRSRSQLHPLTPHGRAGLENPQSTVPALTRMKMNNFGNRGRGGLRRANSNPNNVHSRLGVVTRRGGAVYNGRKPLAVAKRGISKRGQRILTGNRYSNIGLRSDLILQEKRQNRLSQNSLIKSQTFTRSRNSFNSDPSQLTVSVANDFAKRRRNSLDSTGYLNKQSLAQLNNQFSGYNTRRGPGSVRSLNSNRSGRSNGSTHSLRSRGRGRGRGRGGVGRKFVNKQVLNPKLQREIAAIQGKTYIGNTSTTETPSGVNFTPTPSSTSTSMNQRFSNM